MGWYEDWQRQNLAFTPRMDQGGGEYTGYIKDVYEGDDAMPGQEFFPGPNTAQQGRMGMLTPLEIAQQRKAEGRYTSTPGAASLLAASGHQQLGGGPNVGSLDYQRNLRERALGGEVAPGVPTTAVASGDASPTGTGAPWSGMADLAKKTGNLIPEAYLDAGFGMYDKIIADVKRDFDQGGGALDPTSHNNYVQQLIQAGANSETIARLMDRFLPMGESAAGVLAGLGQSTLIGDGVDTAAKYGKGLLGYGSQLVDYLGEQGRFTKKFWGDTYNEQLGNVKDKYKSLFPTAEPTRDWSTLNSGPFSPQGGQFEDFTGEGRGAVANPLMGNSVIIPQDQSWSGGVMDQPPGRGLDKQGWLEKSPLGQMFRDENETSDIVNAHSQGNINPITRKPRQTAKEKLTDLGEGAGSIVDAIVEKGPAAAGLGGTAYVAKLAYDETPVGKLKKKLKTAPDVSPRGEMNKGMIQREIDRLKATKWDRWKAKLPKGLKGINKGKMLAVAAAGIGLFSFADLVFAVGGGDEDVATDWAMDFLDRHPEVMIGIDIGTDPTGAALGGSELLSNRMGPASENYWATPGFGSASGVIDPNWRN